MSKFNEWQRIKHRAGGIYVIIRVPDHRKLEYNGESFYEYESMASGDAWIRCKTEMEDGRFKAI